MENTSFLNNCVQFRLIPNIIAQVNRPN